MTICIGALATTQPGTDAGPMPLEMEALAWAFRRGLENTYPLARKSYPVPMLGSMRHECHA